MESIVNKIVHTIASEQGYSALFRAFVALVGLALLAIGQGLPVVIEKEMAAYKLKFDIEAKYKTALDKVDCAKTDEPANCMFAKYQVKTIGSATDLLDKIVRIGLNVGFALGMLSAIGFVASLFLPQPNDGHPE